MTDEQRRGHDALTQAMRTGVDLVALLNAHRGPFNALLGLQFVAASTDEVVATLEVLPAHHQPYGLVHGGIYCAMAETLASVGAAINAAARGQSTVGLENTTSFMRAVRAGTLTGTASPLARGRRSQVWEVAIRDDEGRLAAQGRVRLLNLDGGSAVAGEVVAVKTAAEG